MNKQETILILTAIHSAYHPSDQTEPSDFTISLWQKFFPEPFDQVMAAVSKIITTSPYEPKIADIRNAMTDNANPNRMSAEEAFNTVRRVWCHMSADTPEEAEPYWKKLPEEIRRIYSPADLIELGRSNSANIENYERPRFLKVYANVVTQVKASEAAGYIVGREPLEEIE